MDFQRQIRRAKARPTAAIVDHDALLLIHPAGVSEIVVTKHPEGWFYAEAVEGWMPSAEDPLEDEPLVACSPPAESVEAAVDALAVEVTASNEEVKRQHLRWLSNQVARRGDSKD